MDATCGCGIPFQDVAAHGNARFGNLTNIRCWQNLSVSLGSTCRPLSYDAAMQQYEQGCNFVHNYARVDRMTLAHAAQSARPRTAIVLIRLLSHCGTASLEWDLKAEPYYEHVMG